MSPNSYCLAAAAGFDARGQIARVVRPETRFAERAQQILQRLEAQEIEGLIGDFEVHLRLRSALPVPGAVRSLAGCLRC